jgi:tetratricopeptide (TPR) repeat protein
MGDSKFNRSERHLAKVALARADHQYAIGCYVEALRLYEQCLTLEADGVTSKQKNGNNDTEQQQPPPARNHHQHAQFQSLHHQGLIESIYRCCIRIRPLEVTRLDRAITCAQELTRINPRSYRFWAMLAEARAARRQFSEAFQSLLTALQLNRHDAQLWLTLGSLLETVLSTTPSTTELWHHRWMIACCFQEALDLVAIDVPHLSLAISKSVSERINNHGNNNSSSIRPYRSHYVSFASTVQSLHRQAVERFKKEEQQQQQSPSSYLHIDLESVTRQNRQRSLPPQSSFTNSSGTLSDPTQQPQWHELCASLTSILLQDESEFQAKEDGTTSEDRDPSTL